MRSLILTAAAAAGILATSVAAQAMPLGVPAVGGLPIENVAACFYLDGWHGPGMYQSGFRRREGRGWTGERREEHREIRDRFGRHLKRRGQ